MNDEWNNVQPTRPRRPSAESVIFESVMDNFLTDLYKNFNGSARTI